MNKRAKRYPKVLNVPLTVEQADDVSHMREAYGLNVSAFCRELLFRAFHKYRKERDEEKRTTTTIAAATRQQ